MTIFRSRRSAQSSSEARLPRRHGVDFSAHIAVDARSTEPMRETLPDEGSLDGQSAEALLSRLVTERFVGRCRFSGELEGELSLHEGVVTTAQARDETGMPAALRLLGLSRGRYRLEALAAGSPPPEGDPVGSWPEVADRLRGRAMHLERLAQPLGGSHQRWRLRQERAACVPPHFAPLAELLGRARAVRDVVTLAPFGLEECVAGLCVLFSLGALRVPFDASEDEDEDEEGEGVALPQVPALLAVPDEPAQAEEPGDGPAGTADDGEPTPAALVPVLAAAGDTQEATAHEEHDDTAHRGPAGDHDVETRDEPNTPRPEGDDVEATADLGGTARGTGRPLPPPGGHALPSSHEDSGDVEEAGCKRWSSQGAPPPTVVEDFDEPAEAVLDAPPAFAPRMILNLTRSVHRGTRDAPSKAPDEALDDEDLRSLAVVPPGMQRALAAAGVIALGTVVGYVLGQL